MSSYIAVSLKNRSSNLEAGPEGMLSPDSHFSTVFLETPRHLAKPFSDYAGYFLIFRNILTPSAICSSSRNETPFASINLWIACRGSSV